MRAVQPPSASPHRRFLVEILHPSAADDVFARWAERLAAGGIVRGIAADPGLRRALPLVAVRLTAAGLDERLLPDERHALLAARLAGAASADAVRTTLAPLGTACAAAGVAPLLLKGTALHGDLYPDPGLRPVSDVDLYVPPAQFDALRSALAACGMVPDAMTAARLAAYDASKGRESRLADFVFSRSDGKGIHVEAKLDPVQLGLALRRGETFLAAARRSRAYPGFLVPAPEPMAVQQALHLARHDGADLLWISEIAAVVARAARHGSFDVPAANDLVRGEGLLGSVRAVFATAESLFPGTIPSALRRGGGSCGATPSRLREAPGARARPSEAAATLTIQSAHALFGGRPLEALGALLRRVHPHPAYVAARMGRPSGLSTRVRRLAQALGGWRSSRATATTRVSS